jgi:flagellar motor switch protein FliM
MGKSNDLHNKLKKVYQREKSLFAFLKEDEINILENFNDFFGKKIKKDLIFLTKKNIQIFSHSIQIKSLLHYKKINIGTSNLIQILPFKNKSFITFSVNFLSVIIDLLFGGRGNAVYKSDEKNKMTSAELCIVQKIINFILSNLNHSIKEFFSSDITFIDARMMLDCNTPVFESNEMYLINCFDLNIDGIEVFFNVLIPFFAIKTLNKKSLFFNKKPKISNNVNGLFSLKDIYDVKLDIVTKITDISMPYDKFCALSVGDVLPLKKPDQVIGVLDNKPIFFGNYQRFNQQNVVFVEEFINHYNLELNKDKECSYE